MQSMYDKLGELLSKSLEEGSIPSFGQDKKNSSPQKAQMLECIIPGEIKSQLKVLHLEKDATYASAKKSFREKLKDIHPDIKGTSSESKRKAGELTEKLISDWKIIDEWHEKTTCSYQ